MKDVNRQITHVDSSESETEPMTMDDFVVVDEVGDVDDLENDVEPLEEHEHATKVDLDNNDYTPASPVKIDLPKTIQDNSGPKKPTSGLENKYEEYWKDFSQIEDQLEKIQPTKYNKNQCTKTSTGSVPSEEGEKLVTNGDSDPKAEKMKPIRVSVKNLKVKMKPVRISVEKLKLKMKPVRISVKNLKVKIKPV